MKRKVELKVDMCDDRSKSKALKITARRVTGVDSISMDMELKKMTVIGDGLDPIFLVRALRKHWPTELVSVSAVTKQEDNNYERRSVRKQEDNNYERKGDGNGDGDGDGGASGGGGGGSGRGDGGDSDGGNNNEDQDPFNQSGGQKGSLLFNLTDYNNWRRKARRVQILMLCFFFEVRLKCSTSERFHRTTADERRAKILDPVFQNLSGWVFW